MTTVAVQGITPEDIEWFLAEVPGATKEELRRWEKAGKIKIVKEDSR